jgi:MoxR-like ATPase
MTGTPPDVARVADAYRTAETTIGRVIVGQEEAVRLTFLTLLCSGHSLLEGVPGVGKTLLVQSLAAGLGIRFGRIQFTPDLMPSDIIGTSVLDLRERETQFRPGPLFTDLLLADEINRASAKTQAALLEAMQEGAATVDGRRHALGPHFAVFATQNPVEHEGTYPLPEAQLDRFLFKIVMEYPSLDEEVAILERHHVDRPAESAPVAALGAGDLDACREIVRSVLVRDEIVGYVAALVRATRSDARFALGASPRAGVWLLRAAKADAAIEGRDYVIPEDVQAVFGPTLRHRIQLEPAAEIEGITPDQALDHTMRSVAVPR